MRMKRRDFLKTSSVAAGAMALGCCFQGCGSLKDSVSDNYFESEFGISDELCRKILAKALQKGGDFADLYFEHSVSNWVALEDGKVNRAYGDISLGVGIRTVQGDQIGYGFTQELTEEAMINAASTAATIANSSGSQPAAQFVQMKTPNYYPLNQLYHEVSLESKLPIVQAVNEKCFKLSDLIIKVNAGFHDQQKRIMVVTSDGVKAEDLLPKSYLYASVVADKNGRVERSSWNYGGRRGFDYYTPSIVDQLSNNAVKRTLTLFDAIQPPAGEMPVVLGPGLSGILLHEHH